MSKPLNKKKPKIPEDKSPPQNEIGGTSLTDLRLPLRLFATDIIPTKRLNIYSSPDLLPFIQNVLRRTREFETIRQSCFGKLFHLPVRQCPVSCKLIHSFLTRQTGLPCGSFPEGYHPDTAKKIVAGRDSVLKSLFGKKEMVTVAQLCRMLETDTNMSGWKKIRIALIIIVDGVLIAHKQKPRPTPRYVRLVENLQKKFPFPWGTESFLKTISCMKPPKFVPIKCEDPVATLVRKLKQFSFRLQGFPLSLQLVAFRAIPQLMDYIPAPSNSLTVMDLEDGLLPVFYHNTPQSLPSTSDAWNLPPIQPLPGWGVWPNDVKEDSVVYLEQLIADQHPFNKQMWPGGATSEPLIMKPKNRVKKKFGTIKQALRPRQPSQTKQRRISSYFTRSSTYSYTNAQLT
ncbi:hypothetical protein F2Q69_00013809 [Brassica cretica]|uniref:DUF1985 domain-containing protein n=1 Tax=Brassica cretica TaxID=69181 RepID=A0A8S9R040_BRACR|nr:hypothetical protein F2Q69_00013809 [Brassica cretica]